MTCVFCSIVAGDEEASFVHEGERAVAFLDIAPASEGHLLVVPRRHAPSLAELADEDAAAMLPLARRAAAALRRSSVRCDGVNLWLADGEVAGQDVFHVHLHVVPRFAGDGVRLVADFDRPEREALDAVAEQVRAAWP
jgi:diadenosine tetraphosphate (Ap4A) HIT family hydrolase